MGVRRDRPFPVQPRANRDMGLVLRVATALALACGIAGTVLPDVPALGWAAVVIVTTMPVARVAWLGVRWVQRRDWTFALLAAGLLAVIAAGGVAAALIG